MFLYYINSSTLISLILKLHFLRTTGQSQLLNSSIKWIFIISHRDHVNVSHMMNKGSPPGYGGEPVCQYPFKQKSACAFCKNCNFKSFTLIPFTWASSYFPLFFLICTNLTSPSSGVYNIHCTPGMLGMTIEFSTHASNMFFHAAEQDKKQNNNPSFYRPIVIYCADGVTPR